MTSITNRDVPPPSEFAERLLADKSGVLCNEYRRLMEDVVATGNERLRHPLEQPAYAATKALVDSAAVAAQAVQDIWESMHLNAR